MDQDVQMFGQVMFVIVSSIAALVVIGLGARYMWRLGSRRQTPLSADPARLERLEHAIDAIAIETERISEGQRFTVSLLSERLPVRADERLGVSPPRAVPSRHDTPH